MKCPKCNIEMDRHDKITNNIYQESLYVCPKCNKQIEEEK